MWSLLRFGLSQTIIDEIEPQHIEKLNPLAKTTDCEMAADKLSTGNLRCMPRIYKAFRAISNPYSFDAIQCIFRSNEQLFVDRCGRRVNAFV